MIVRAYDARNGTLLWDDRVDKAGTDELADGGVAVLGGRVFATGSLSDTSLLTDLLSGLMSPETTAGTAKAMTTN
jgi:hypothetical protein